jgi:PAS domain S-box-containing protein/diguanylate cyclase (GGDEF)-like protein
LRLGVSAVIVITVAFACLQIVPMISRERSALRDLSTRKLESLSMIGELQDAVEENGRSATHLMMARPGPEALQRGIDRLHAQDAAIQQSQDRIARLGAESLASQTLFQARWQSYLRERDNELAHSPAGELSEWNGARTDRAGSAFLSVERAVREDAAEILDASDRQIGEISDALSRALVEFLISTAIKIVVLVLLIRIDWKRVQMRRQLEQANRHLRASEERFQRAYESAVVGMGIFKLDGTVISANARAAQILGYEVSELIGRNVGEFMAPECVEDHRRKFSSLPGGAESSYQAERRVLRKDGSEAWVRNSVTLVRQEGGEPHIFSVTEEITHQRRANDRLEYLANYDPVTNLPNRHSFEEELSAALSHLAGTTDCVALIYLEIDSFDFLKATFGRTIADEVLAELGASLAGFCQEGELVGRIDDHIFGMLFKAASYNERTMMRAGELREIFHHASESGRHRLPLSASIGIAFSSDGSGVSRLLQHGASSTPAETLLKYARAAMLEARSRGGDSIFVADPALQERAAQRHQIESALLRGLRQDEFRVVFQPQFQVATGRLIRFEALCRWTSAELGPISPDRFIPIAEQTGLIMEIGRRVLIDALRQASHWTASGRRIGVAVNISPLQFMRPDFTEVITEVLAETQFPAALLELEITEGIFIRDLNLAVARIRELQRLGLSIALDDFGTGYSSLSYLQRMPIDAVKLDRSFVSDLTTEASTVSMVRSVLAMADALHLRVVSEGVETQEQLEILRSLGCEEAQGYLLGRPESSELALQRVMESPLLSIGTLA